MNISTLILKQVPLYLLREKLFPIQHRAFIQAYVNGLAAQEGVNYTIDALETSGSIITAIPEPVTLFGALGATLLLLREEVKF